MNKFFLFASVWIFFTGCKNSDKQADEADGITTTTQFAWVASLNDTTGKLEIIKSENTGPDTVSVDSMIAYLNQTNTNIQLRLIKISGDTICLSIPDAEYLTQRMGSAGPVLFFSTAVYNLTEIPGYNFVNFDFDPGDHASPGTYSRNSFKDE